MSLHAQLAKIQSTCSANKGRATIRRTLTFCEHAVQHCGCMFNVESIKSIAGWARRGTGTRRWCSARRRPQHACSSALPAAHFRGGMNGSGMMEGGSTARGWAALGFGRLQEESRSELPAICTHQQHVAHKQTSIHLQKYEGRRVDRLMGDNPAGTDGAQHSSPTLVLLTDGFVDRSRGRVNRAHMRRAVDRGKKKDGLHTREGNALKRRKNRTRLARRAQKCPRTATCGVILFSSRLLSTSFLVSRPSAQDLERATPTPASLNRRLTATSRPTTAANTAPLPARSLSFQVPHGRTRRLRKTMAARAESTFLSTATCALDPGRTDGQCQSLLAQPVDRSVCPSAASAPPEARPTPAPAPAQRLTDWLAVVGTRRVASTSLTSTDHGGEGPSWLAGRTQGRPACLLGLRLHQGRRKREREGGPYGMNNTAVSARDEVISASSLPRSQPQPFLLPPLQLPAYFPTATHGPRHSTQKTLP
ncbi:hypothetical protein IWX50DRAFT_618944 [Phyllosticta citricarpa]|uniref:Uncharacterized protein n=1 Tax=Phyllosticta citricarpa TaxID=55181 RepID=A0ABR1MJE3_9PEZI